MTMPYDDGPTPQSDDPRPQPIQPDTPDREEDSELGGGKRQAPGYGEPDEADKQDAPEPARRRSDEE